MLKAFQDVGNHIFINVLSPQHVEVFVTVQSFGDGVTGQHSQHRVDIHQTVTVTVHEDDRCYDITGREPRRPIRADGCSNNGGDDIIIIHLEGAVPHDLEPVHHGFHGGERIKVCISCDLLVRRDIKAVPVEQEY